ncbi:S9 family peptidase [Terriglobus sp.]|uniref:S9 family peptidase n=1 Tax=Terriglobus sp. TaxID=1889013 RepID=UPI003B00A0FE
MTFATAPRRALLAALAFVPVLTTVAQSPQKAPDMTLAQPSPRVAAAMQAMEAQRNTGLRQPGAVEISPDGKQIAWTLYGGGGASGGGRRGGGGGSLHISPIDNPKPEDTTVTAGEGCSASNPRWSPDGKTLAFTATCADGQPQLWLRDNASGSVKQITHITGAMTSPAWAPDGSSIAFLYVENATRAAGALAAMKPPAGVIGEDGVEVQWVAAADAHTGALSVLTPKTLHAYEFDWAPDAKHIAFTASNPPGENTWWIAQMYTVPVGQPDQAKSILNPKHTIASLQGLQIAVPRYSTNGRDIAFIGGLMSDQGSTGGDIYLMGADGSGLQDLTPGRKSTPVYLAWADPDHIVFSEDVSGKSHLGLLGTNKKELFSGWTEPQSIGSGRASLSFSFAPSARAVAFVSSGPDKAPEIYAGDFRGIRPVTHLNDAVKSTNRTVSIEWNNDNFHVQGWLSLPANYDPSKKYPMIVSVHGGPSAEVGPSFGNPGGSLYTQLGYFVFQPNPRGSFGQGESFTAANRKDFGYGDLRDILAGVDQVEKQYPVDDNRLGLTGWSYGGFMTMFGVTQTHRFHAAVAGAGISDWLSYYGENFIDQWMVPFFGASVYDDPSVYQKSSAITYIKQVTTPTLVIVGDRDGECPAPQSYEFWHALRAEGVKSQLVIYPAEGHGFVNPTHIRDRNIRSADWFEQYLNGQPATDQRASTR